MGKQGGAGREFSINWRFLLTETQLTGLKRIRKLRVAPTDDAVPVLLYFCASFLPRRRFSRGLGFRDCPVCGARISVPSSAPKTNSISSVKAAPFTSEPRRARKRIATRVTSLFLLTLLFAARKLVCVKQCANWVAHSMNVFVYVDETGKIRWTLFRLNVCYKYSWLFHQALFGIFDEYLFYPQSMSHRSAECEYSPNCRETRATFVIFMFNGRYLPIRNIRIYNN